MNILGPAASRGCLNPRTILQTCHKFDCSLAARLAQQSTRLSSSSALPLRRREQCSKPLRGSYRPLTLALAFQGRGFASKRIITQWEDLPQDYKDEDGLEFGPRLLSQKEIHMIFGTGMNVVDGNLLLTVLHGRRVAGTLGDPEYQHVSGFEQKAHEAALSWLRKKVPVNEDYSEGMRADQELAAMGAEVIADAERIGLYKPNTPQPGTEGKTVYGTSGLDKIREAKENEWNTKEVAKEAKKKQAAEIRQVSGDLETVRPTSNVVLRRPGANPRLKYYLEKAKVLPDRPPEMSVLQRLGPSALVVLCVVGASVLFTMIYTPPPHSARLFQDMPPAAATINMLILANLVVFGLWHFPPAFRMLEKYFIAIPGYPRALSMLGCIFSHKSASHLAMNMVGLWFVGTRLHDDVGRANFLAIYLSCGVLSSFTSLTYFVLRNSFISSSLGASGAIWGILAAYLSLHGDEKLKILGLPPDPMSGIPGLGFLAILLGLEVISMTRMRKTGGPGFDHLAHLGGAFAGICAAQVLKNKAEQKRRREMERRKQLGLIDRIKEGRL